MAFHKSAKDVDVIDGYLLAICTDCSGQDQEAELKLDLYLGNSNGFFEWGGTNFSRSTKDMVVINEGDSIFLHAKLETKNLTWRDAKVNLSDRITNSNGVLKYMDGKEPHVERNREFLGEERDFLSTAISETFSDLRDLLTDSPLFSTRKSGQSGRKWHSDSPDKFNGSREATGLGTPHFDMGDSTTSIGTSLADSKGDPPSYGKSPYPYQAGSERNSSTYSDISKKDIEPHDIRLRKVLDSKQCETDEDEDTILQKVKEFLLKDDGNCVRSFKTEKDGRGFELREVNGVTRTLHIKSRVLFDQDDYKTPSISEASDHEYDHCLTPSVVDGEDEYDFLSR